MKTRSINNKTDRNGTYLPLNSSSTAKFLNLLSGSTPSTGSVTLHLFCLINGITNSFSFSSLAIELKKSNKAYETVKSEKKTITIAT